MFTICQSGKNKHLFEYTQANAVVCSLYCNSTISTVPKETTQRVWSNASNWPNGYVPKAGENVTIPASWTIILDVDPAPAAYLIIDGAVIADDSRDVNITAKAIFIRQGSLNAGSPGNPFTHKLTIQINGNK
jgi:G8 domain